MSPYRPSGTIQASFWPGLWPCLASIFIAIVAILVVLCVGEFQRLCGNKLHTEWTGKPPNVYHQIVHPVPRKEIREMFVLRRTSKSKLMFCNECAEYAERLLLAGSGKKCDPVGQSSSLGVNIPVRTGTARLETSTTSTTTTLDLRGAGPSSYIVYESTPAPADHDVSTSNPSDVSTSTTPKTFTERMSLEHTQNAAVPGVLPSSMNVSDTTSAFSWTLSGLVTAIPKIIVKPTSSVKTWLYGDKETVVLPSVFQYPAPLSGWVVQDCADNYGKLYMNITQFPQHGPSIRKMLQINQDQTWNIQILGREVENEHLSDQSYLTSESASQLLDTLDKLHVCIGHPGVQFKQLIKDGAVGKKGFTYPDVVMEKENVYVGTIRHKDCSMVSHKSTRCSSCEGFRGTLRSWVSKKRKSQATSTCRITPGSKVKFSSLHRSELEKRAQNIAATKKKLTARLNRAQKRIEKMVASEGKQLPTTVTNAFNIIIDEEKDAVAKMFKTKPNSFGHLFWQQQMEAARKNPKGHRWHPMMIKWCLNLRLSSPKGYNIMRNSGILKLPCDTTLRNYVHWTGATSGLTRDSVKQLMREIDIKNREPYQKYVCLVHDEMKVKGELVYQKSTGNLVGFTSLGDFSQQLRSFDNHHKESTAPEDNIAEYMFVIMVRGLFWNFTYPLAHYPTSSTTAAEIYNLVYESIEALAVAGIKVVAITCDGASTNRKFADMHGRPQSVPVYKSVHPYSFSFVENKYANEIFLLTDPPHLVKCVRNSWANSFANNETRMLWNGGNISWKLLEDLYKRDVNMNGLYLSKKINYEHVHLTSYSKMKVNLAAQVLSSTVANALELYGPAYAANVEFVRTFDRFFDCLNVRSRREWFVKRKDDLKPYVSPEDERLKWLEVDFTKYLDDWKKRVEERPGISRTEKNKMQITHETLAGLYRTARGFAGLAKFLLQQPGVQFLLSERLNQDPLESFFGNQRQMRGGNDAPSVAQFNVNINASKLKSSQTIKVFGGNTRQKRGLCMDMEIDNTPLPKRLKKN